MANDRYFPAPELAAKLSRMDGGYRLWTATYDLYADTYTIKAIGYSRWMEATIVGRDVHDERALEYLVEEIQYRLFYGK